ncbi:helix-turn-helix domain-containing protein [Acidocella aminolytica]|uniref:Uncharacterized protein n=1 Tax=Acidocella aminolytica 101 = DSM 11237 TaxID=1120923 RepID=A0A0D6PIG4_9PROT|nr:helix-turn-helix domain-containing protein [Acidocella aminolytica]GAN81457.1 hypothetical protein Aam_096_016 [Acidocella aminolytica 101 = DSM 11237]GBQ35068.1 hypothetical protein AA11237_0892 [Acidocella aminolytica 101 = DSM 11237]SHF01979.1 hypothetical protein SAMN02746095_01868 [Acidocella aminolytica 101 = DSM 11237]
MNDEDFATKLDAAFASLLAKPREPRGRRAILAAQIEKIREAIARGYTVSEILDELRAHGVHISRALLRQVMAEADNAKQGKKPRKQQVGVPSSQEMPKLVNVPAGQVFPGEPEHEEVPLNFVLTNGED